MTIENFTPDEKDKNLSRNHKNKLTFQENTEPLDIIIESDIIEPDVNDDEDILNLNSNLMETTFENSIPLPEEIFNLIFISLSSVCFCRQKIKNIIELIPLYP